MSRRFLTKSRFKVGHECATKLYYLDDKRFGNTKADNAFLKALAEGGFQVGELAKQYISGGTEITTTDKALAVAQTNELLQKDTAVIYEGAIQFGDLFIRADILVKSKGKLELIEVKAKSFDPSKADLFYTKSSLKKGKPEISSDWEPYLIDVAFQAYVAQRAFPELEILPSLMLADKSLFSSVDGLNQLFTLEKQSDGRVRAVARSGISSLNLGTPILTKVDVQDPVRLLHGTQFEKHDQSFSFAELVHFLERVCTKREFVSPDVGSHCKGCEFRISKDLKEQGQQSGFEDCWKHSHQLQEADFQRDFVFDIWNFRRAGKLIEAGKLFIDQVEEQDVTPAPSKAPGLSSSERQWLQVESVQTHSASPFLDVSGLSREFSTWKYPLHFIDFETTMVAIPFHKGRRPYEQIAFQFSHHMVHADGRIEHKDEYLDFDRGKFPNFDFLRALKRSLSSDNGTIFRYAAHENTVLNQIKSQLHATKSEVPDSSELVAFIESITDCTTANGEISGPRSMVDMCELVKNYFYHPKMKGSNSIKKVLPAVLECSDHIRTKYGQPIYGTSTLPSRNFTNWSWVQIQEGSPLDPYKLLPPIFNDISLDEIDSLILEGSIADGGAAMTAYSRMQFTNMSDKERNLARQALLKYCELDTLAMVMIFEYWKSEVDRVGMGVVA